MTRRHALALTIPALALGIALAGCGDGGTPSTASPTTDANRQADGWDEDIIVKPENLPACSPNCANADLRGQDMSYAPLGLNQVNLEGADLRGADISGASMAGIRLAKANLGETRAVESIFNVGSLQGASAVKADFTRALFKSTNLQKVDFTDAKLLGAYLVQADLRGANLTRANLTGATFRRNDTQGATFSNTICPNGKKTNSGC